MGRVFVQKFVMAVCDDKIDLTNFSDARVLLTAYQAKMKDGAYVGPTTFQFRLLPPHYISG